MRIALVHNYYQHPGGEDRVFANESDLLAARGHTVIPYTAHNASVAAYGRLRLAGATIWNREHYRSLRALFRRERPAVVHVHNTLPLISPAVYAAARAEGAAVVQTLHNYRLICPSGLLFRQGRPCEDCVGRRVAWPGVVHGCYRDDRSASAVVAGMLAWHWARGTYRHAVDRYIALTEFGMNKFVEGGLAPEQIVVKPNFVIDDPGVGEGGDYALFVGRLTEEKGVPVMLEAWRRIEGKIPLRIAGDGPLHGAVEKAAAAVDGIEFLGQLPPSQLTEQMQGAAMLVFSSLWYEGFPLVMAEAFAAGTPVVASRLGAAAEIVDNRRTGVHFEPGDSSDLARQIVALIDDPTALSKMRAAARREYEQKYAADVNYARLMEIYQDAMAARERRIRATGPPLP